MKMNQTKPSDMPRLNLRRWGVDICIHGLLLPLLLLLTLTAVVQAQFSYTTDNGAITITGYTGPGGAVTIPDTIDGLPVTSIGHRAFYISTNLASVTIPDSVTSIGNFAFAYCASLAGVTIPNSVTSIGDYSFYYCSLTNVTIPNGVTNIGDSAFFNCTNLLGITIGNSVTRIGRAAFECCASLSFVTIPDSVTSIGDLAFESCTGLTSVTIPSSVTSLGSSVFRSCTSLSAIRVDTHNPAYSSVDGVLLNKNQTILIQYPGRRNGSYMIPSSVVSVGNGAFFCCAGLTSVTIPKSVTSVGGVAFAYCTNLTSIYCQGNAPEVGWYAFAYDYLDFSVHYINATVYYLPGTTGWTSTLGNLSTALWIEVPSIQTSPQTQTAEAGSAVSLCAQATNSLPLFYLWYFNGTNFISSSTNGALKMTNVQFSQSGAYTVVISNALGKVTSAPAMLSVIPPVERRWVPGLRLLGQPGSALNLAATETLVPAPNWEAFDSVVLTDAAQWYFDLTALPPQRLFRAWQPGAPVAPALEAHLVPALTLTGSVGSNVRVEGINCIGPTDAWFPLATVTLTNSSQLYFDVSVIGQPPRLWRLVQVP